MDIDAQGVMERSFHVIGVLILVYIGYRLSTIVGLIKPFVRKHRTTFIGLGSAFIFAVLFLIYVHGLVITDAEAIDAKLCGTGYFEISRRLACLEPNNLGDFFAGTFASLAFIILGVTVFIQTLELRAQKKELKGQKNELKLTRKVLKSQAEFTKVQTELLSEEGRARIKTNKRLVKSEIKANTVKLFDRFQTNQIIEARHYLKEIGLPEVTIDYEEWSEQKKQPIRTFLLEICLASSIIRSGGIDRKMFFTVMARPIGIALERLKPYFNYRKQSGKDLNLIEDFEWLEDEIKKYYQPPRS